MIFIVIISILLLSIGLSILSLRKELRKTKHEEEVSGELAKGKILFYSPGDSSSSET